MRRPAIGLGFQSDKTADDYAHLARLAEERDVDVLSVYSDLGFQPPIVALTVMAQATERVRLGPACLNPYSLAPVEIAGQIAALDVVSKGRAYLGLARGTWLEAVGIRQVRAVTALRETVEVCRRLWGGDTTGFEGEAYRLEPGFALETRPMQPSPPVMVGTWGPETLAMAGEMADEVKIGGSANPDVVPWAREQIRRGSERAGRSPADVGVCVGAVTVVDEDGDAARHLARREVAMYLAVVASLDPTISVPEELIASVRAKVATGDHDGAGRLIPSDVLERFAFAGTPEEVAAHAQRVTDAGATRIEFGTPHGLTNEEGVRLIGDRVVPHFR
jgi:5,10-methylenetetrahydromethanopterin reductase